MKVVLCLIAEYPEDCVFLLEWLYSLKHKNDYLNNVYPWLNFKTIKFLDRFLNKKMYVFEYGSGYSTLYLAQRVKQVISVEYDESWYKIISDRLKKPNLFNVNYIFVCPRRERNTNKNPEDPDSYCSGFSKCSDLDFAEYVKVIEQFPDKSFDLILIDGRARQSCIKHAITKLKNNGVIILDNSDRARYNVAKRKLLSCFRCMCLRGIGPYEIASWETSVYINNNNNNSF